MGKKARLSKEQLVIREERAGEREEEQEENDLEKELAAVEQIRRERELEQRKAMMEEEESGEEDEEEAEDGGDARPSYNREAMVRCLADWETLQLPFLETMTVEGFEVHVENELDDIEREVSFYNHALKAVQEGQKRLKELHVPTTRPNDYFCEQVKSDAHMARVKDKLLVEQKRMEAFEQRKNREQNKKFNKQLSEKKRKEKKDEQEQLLHEIDEIKTQSKGGDKDSKLERILNNPGKSKKRQNMDKKYGFGGKDKKFSKMNDKKSLNDSREFHPHGGKFNRLQRNRGNHKKANRPGKEARKSARAGGRGK